MAPTFARDLNNSRRARFDQAVARKGKGSNAKDLFYHLVSNFWCPRTDLGLTELSS